MKIPSYDCEFTGVAWFILKVLDHAGFSSELHRLKPTESFGRGTDSESITVHVIPHSKNSS